MLRAEAEPYMMSLSFKIQLGSTSYNLDPDSPFLLRKLWVTEGDELIGSVYRPRLISREFIIDLAGTLPLGMQVFIDWLATVMWRRQQGIS